MPAKRAWCGLLLCLSGFALAAQDVYWELPRALPGSGGGFPELFSLPARDGGGEALLVFRQEAETGSGQANGGGRAWISTLGFEAGEWSPSRRIAGPYEYRGDEPLLYSAAQSKEGRLALAVAAAGAIEVYFSDDRGKSFSLAATPRPPEPALAPRIFPSASGGWLLFVTQGREESLSLYSARSADGRTWSEFIPFVAPGEGLALNFLPAVLPLPERGLDLVVFQSLVVGERASFQLFSKTSADGGASWGPARQVSDFLDPLARERRTPENFDNQRPALAYIEGKIWLAWERAPLTGQTQIYAMNLDQAGLPIAATADRVSSGSGACQDPRLLEIEGQPALVWFDNRRGGNRIFLARRRGLDWPEEDLSGGRGDAAFGRVAIFGGKPYAVWQGLEAGRRRLFLLEPDASAAPPGILPLDFTVGLGSRRESVNFRLELPPDSSGFEGYSTLWGRDPEAEPEQSVEELANQIRLTRLADEDGPWYLAVAAKDYAGNWSKTARIRFDRDRTPPPPPVALPPAQDEGGFLASNSFSVEWLSPFKAEGGPVEDLAGYTWLLRYAGPLESAGVLAAGARGRSGSPSLPGLTAYESLLVSRAGPPLPPPLILGKEARVSYSNVDDGYYLFSVAAIDRTGNIGDAATILLRANKFRPYTTVAYADASRDDFGRLSLRIFGRGFLAEGRIERVVLDRDGRMPYDVERTREEGGFRIASDRELGGLSFEELEPGRYRLGLYHAKRGWYWSGPLLEVDEAGTVKFGQVVPAYQPSWRLPEPARPLLSFYDAIIGLFLLFALAGLVLTLARTFSVVGDGERIRHEVLALVSGGPMSLPTSAAKARALGFRGSRLRRRFTLVIALLVIFVVVLVSLPLGAFMIRTQGRSLAEGLRERAFVLLESLGQGARSYLPAGNLLELGFLPQQAKAMADASYITLTGYPAESSTDLDAVWASNDPGLAAKLDGPVLRPGSSRLSDGLSPKIPAIAQEINRRAALEVGAVNDTLAALTQEGRALATRLDAASQRRLEEISATSRELERSINEKLAALADQATSSDPPFDPDQVLRVGGSYLFYKPILYRRGQDQVYYRGMVRLEVSTELIRASVARAQEGLVRMTLIIAAAALGIGVAGAFLLSSQIVRPIREVIAAIETIRRTADKEELADFTVEVKTRDELATLAAAANELKRDLVVAAKESKALEKGSDIQQLLIPLDDGGGDKKLTVGHLDRPEFEIYGYYKGAKRVSGDYWDFRPLDQAGRYYYFIKCDVSGKDVEAAFIMVQVVTMVINHFVDWPSLVKRPGFDLDRLTYRINDFINDRGYRGKFAAFTLGVFSATDGALQICHAGDNLLHFWRAASSSLEVEALHSSPAAGSFPRELVELKSPYKTVSRRLERGDIFMLYTDGIEEAKRHFRGPDFKVIRCAEVPEDQPHGNHSGGQDGEELGFERISEFLSALETRGRYRLEKAHDPLPEDILGFDFSKATGSLDERIVGLLSMEKLFRIYPDPAADLEQSILVDKRIDAFLAKFFDQYRLLFRERQPVMQRRERRLPDGSMESFEVEDPNYVRFRALREDEQYDDLTILGIRRK